MGELNLPSGGLVYLDASGFIYSAERIEPYRTLLEPMWHQADAGEITIVSSDLVVMKPWLNRSATRTIWSRIFSYHYSIQMSST